MDYAEKGSKTYLFTIVLVAVLGGLLFGYDTAVISGAEKDCRHSSWERKILYIRMDGTALHVPARSLAALSAVLFLVIWLRIGAGKNR